MNKKVIWIEAIPEIYEKLVESISKFGNQKAYCALIGDEHMVYKTFYLSSNNKESSSVFNFAADSGYPEINMDGSIDLKMSTLNELFTSEEISNYSHWVIDVQGAELMVIKGSLKLLKNCKSLLIEVSTRNIYEGGARYSDLLELLEMHGFHALWEPSANSHEDVIFIRY